MGRPNSCHNWEYEHPHDIRWIQPSLRDLWDAESKPGSELPGYFHISLRERETVDEGVWTHRNERRELKEHFCFCVLCVLCG